MTYAAFKNTFTIDFVYIVNIGCLTVLLLIGILILDVFLGSCWWWLAGSLLLRHKYKALDCPFKAAHFHIRRFFNFLRHFWRYSVPMRLLCDITVLTTWHLFFDLIGYWSCDMWPHPAHLSRPHYHRIFVMWEIP